MLAVQEVSTFVDLQTAIVNAPTSGELTEIVISGNIDVTAQITVDSGRNVQITGTAGERRVLDAKASYNYPRRHFEVGSGSTLALINLELTNGYVYGDSSGGAVYIESAGTFTATECTFSGNTAASDTCFRLRRGCMGLLVDGR